MAELVALRSSITQSGVGRQEEVNSFIAQGCSIMRDLDNFNTLSQLLLTLNFIRSYRLLTGGIPISIKDSVSIETLWLWISNQTKRNQSRGNTNFSQKEHNQYHDIYRDVQESLEEKHNNE